MPDDYVDLKSPSEEEQSPQEDDEGPSSQLYRWAHFPGGIVLGVLFFALHGQPWGWQIAIGCGYTVYVFFFAFGMVLKDADDFFGDPRVIKCAVKLLVPHLLFLIPILVGVTLWFEVRPSLPSWMTQEGHKESLWDLFGWLVLACAGVAQGFWMGSKVKRYFRKAEDRD